MTKNITHKDIEYISKIANSLAKLLFKKVDSDMVFLGTLEDKQYLDKKLKEIHNNILIYSDILNSSHLLSIEYIKSHQFNKFLHYSKNLKMKRK